MDRLFVLVFTLSMLAIQAKAQLSEKKFDTAQFIKKIDFANWLTEYEYITQLGAEKYRHQPEKNSLLWFSYKHDNNWFTIGGETNEDVFTIVHHLKIDSSLSLNEYNGRFDTTRIQALGAALIQSERQFQIVRDSSSIFFSSFVVVNPDASISIWYLPAFQPSGQAIYGCEWEYTYDSSGEKLISKNSIITRISGVWIGQPREIWLNFRETDFATVGSLFFALSFRDYFTRLRIDTRISTSSTSRDVRGNYSWTHKMK